eukprot:TRINITY_DN2228_c0_g1_i12.p1 TRINITY_DN2228_c0_g1~~TRINITY_DN2228_c0_g1_i12.p1  ORF type:complete len:530 (-),score=128.86 TRINITY_DN2228_c0_g1_i12:160-1749(-)
MLPMSFNTSQDDYDIDSMPLHTFMDDEADKNDQPTPTPTPTTTTPSHPLPSRSIKQTNPALFSKANRHKLSHTKTPDNYDAKLQSLLNSRTTVSTAPRVQIPTQKSKVMKAQLPIKKRLPSYDPKKSSSAPQSFSDPHKSTTVVNISTSYSDSMHGKSRLLRQATESSTTPTPVIRTGNRTKKTRNESRPKKVSIRNTSIATHKAVNPFQSLDTDLSVGQTINNSRARQSWFNEDTTESSRAPNTVSTSTSTSTSTTRKKQTALKLKATVPGINNTETHLDDLDASQSSDDDEVGIPLHLLTKKSPSTSTSKKSSAKTATKPTKSRKKKSNIAVVGSNQPTLDSMSLVEPKGQCPICHQQFPISVLQQHVNTELELMEDSSGNDDDNNNAHTVDSSHDDKQHQPIRQQTSVHQNVIPKTPVLNNPFAKKAKSPGSSKLDFIASSLLKKKRQEQQQEEAGHEQSNSIPLSIDQESESQLLVPFDAEHARNHDHGDDETLDDQMDQEQIDDVMDASEVIVIPDSQESVREV